MKKEASFQAQAESSLLVKAKQAEREASEVKALFFSMKKVCARWHERDLT